MIEIKMPVSDDLSLDKDEVRNILQRMYDKGHHDGVEAYRAMMELEKEEKDLISRQAVIYYIKPYIQEIITESGVDKNERTNRILRLIINGIETMPTGRGCRHEEDAEDCTSRQEAISAIQDEYYDHAVGIYIVDIIANLPAVTPKAESKSVLDKIKAEIEQKCCITVGSENEPAITLYDVFQIINKYKAHVPDINVGKIAESEDEA